MDYVILLSVLLFSVALNLFKQVGVSVIFALFVLERFTPDLSGVFKLTTSLESTVPEKMSTVYVTQKLLDMSIKGSTVNQKVFPSLSILLKLFYPNSWDITPRKAISPTVLFLIPKKPKVKSDITNLLVPENTS